MREKFFCFEVKYNYSKFPVYACVIFNSLNEWDCWPMMKADKNKQMGIKIRRNRKLSISLLKRKWTTVEIETICESTNLAPFLIFQNREFTQVRFNVIELAKMIIFILTIVVPWEFYSTCLDNFSHFVELRHWLDLFFLFWIQRERTSLEHLIDGKLHLAWALKRAVHGEIPIRFGWAFFRLQLKPFGIVRFCCKKLLPLHILIILNQLISY